jgi:hypothetical protein
MFCKNIGFDIAINPNLIRLTEDTVSTNMETDTVEKM